MADQLRAWSCWATWPKSSTFSLQSNKPTWKALQCHDLQTRWSTLRILQFDFIYQTKLQFAITGSNNENIRIYLSPQQVRHQQMMFSFYYPIWNSYQELIPVKSITAWKVCYEMSPVYLFSFPLPTAQELHKVISEYLKNLSDFSSTDLHCHFLNSWGTVNPSKQKMISCSRCSDPVLICSSYYRRNGKTWKKIQMALRMAENIWVSFQSLETMKCFFF